MLLDCRSIENTILIRSVLLALGTCIFLFDFFLPLGVAIGMLYACIVIFAAKYSAYSDVLLIAVGCTMLVLLGAVVGVTIEGVPLWIGIVNRIMSVIVIWVPVTFLIQDYRKQRMLQAVNEELESKVAARTADLELHREDLRLLTGRLIVAHEEERQRLARELHDDFCQRLGMVLLDLHVFEKELPPPGLSAETRLRRMRSTVSRLSDDMRRLAHELHPSMLQDQAGQQKEQRRAAYAIQRIVRQAIDQHHP